jgi:hypothetical protein
MPDDRNAVVAEFAGLWKPGKMCNDRSVLKDWCEHGSIIAHPLPPPDFTQPANAWRLYGAIVRQYQVMVGPLDETYKENYFCAIEDEGTPVAFAKAATPEEALLKAVYALAKEHYASK